MLMYPISAIYSFYLLRLFAAFFLRFGDQNRPSRQLRQAHSAFSQACLPAQFYCILFKKGTQHVIHLWYTHHRWSPVRMRKKISLIYIWSQMFFFFVSSQISPTTFTLTPTCILYKKHHICNKYMNFFCILPVAMPSHHILTHFQIVSLQKHIFL